VDAPDSDPDTALGSSVEFIAGSYSCWFGAMGSARATAAGDGTGPASLIDETEATQWASLGAPVAGRQVTVRLAESGTPIQLRRVQVSAALSPPQNRFSALRSFEILACETRGGVDCSRGADFEVIFRSAADAFPSVAPRPRQPELNVRSFAVPRTRATHVRLRVVANQCTGGPDFAGEQDQDPRARTDCSTASAQAVNVRAAELQVFER
jgi:extracellular elastinolytic metalloproteinase